MPGCQVTETFKYYDNHIFLWKKLNVKSVGISGHQEQKTQKNVQIVSPVAGMLN